MGKSVWGKCDPNKVPGRRTLPKSQKSYSIEVSTHPAKNSRSSVILTQFDTLPLEILHKIDECHFSLVHNEKLNKVLMLLTQNTPVLR